MKWVLLTALVVAILASEQAANNADETELKLYGAAKVPALVSFAAGAGGLCYNMSVGWVNDSYTSWIGIYQRDSPPATWGDFQDYVEYVWLRNEYTNMDDTQSKISPVIVNTLTLAGNYWACIFQTGLYVPSGPCMNISCLGTTTQLPTAPTTTPPTTITPPPTPQPTPPPTPQPTPPPTPPPTPQPTPPPTPFPTPAPTPVRRKINVGYSECFADCAAFAAATMQSGTGWNTATFLGSTCKSTDPVVCLRNITYEIPSNDPLGNSPVIVLSMNVTNWALVPGQVNTFVLNNGIQTILNTTIIDAAIDPMNVGPKSQQTMTKINLASVFINQNFTLCYTNNAFYNYSTALRIDYLLKSPSNLVTSADIANYYTAMQNPVGTWQIGSDLNTNSFNCPSATAF